MTAAPATLTDEQRIAWLRLIRTDTIGPAAIMAQTPEMAEIHGSDDMKGEP